MMRRITLGLALLGAVPAMAMHAKAVTPEAPMADLSVTIQPVRNDHGKLIYTLYDSAESFAQDNNEYRRGVIEAHEGVVTAVIRGIKPGWYALTVFHDENGNGKFDTNFLGMPKEMFGISNVIETLWSRPKWDEVRFEISAGQKNEIPIKMKWQ